MVEIVSPDEEMKGRGFKERFDFAIKEATGLEKYGLKDSRKTLDLDEIDFSNIVDSLERQFDFDELPKSLIDRICDDENVTIGEIKDRLRRSLNGAAHPAAIGNEERKYDFRSSRPSRDHRARVTRHAGQSLRHDLT